MTTATVDDKQRVRLKNMKPGQVLAVQDNGDGSVTLCPVKPDVQEPFPPGCQEMKDAADRWNKEWAGVKIKQPAPPKDWE